MANLFFDFPCATSCSDQVSASQAKGKSADPAEASESFESVVKKLLANDDPDAQAEASAVASAVAAGGLAASGTELVVTQAAEIDGETSKWQDTQWASTSLAIGTAQQVSVDAVDHTSLQSDAMAMPVDPSLARQLGQADGSSQAGHGDAALDDIGVFSSADASAELETLADGVSVDGIEPLGDADSSDAGLPSEARRDATVSDSDGIAEALSAGAGTPQEASGNANSGEPNEQSQTPDEFASTETDRGNAEPAVSPPGGELVENAAADTDTAESLEERLASGRLADTAVPTSGAPEGSPGRSVAGGDAADAGGLSESSGSVAGSAATEQAVASSETSNSRSAEADRFDNELTSDGRVPANDADSAIDDAVTIDLAGQDAQQPLASGLASGSAGEAVHEDASAVGAIRPVTKQSVEDSESVDVQDAGDLSVDLEVLESVSIETESQPELGGQQSGGGDSFDPMVSGEPIDVTPDTSEQPSVVPIDSPFDAAAEMSVEQEILESLSLEEFISQSPASPEAVKKTAEVIHDAMRSSLQLEGQTVRVEIHPAELGTLKIQVTQSDQAIETQIIATEFVTSELLTSHRDQLMEALSDLGFETSDVNIFYEDQSSTESESRQAPAEHRYQSKPETQSQVSRASVSGGGVNIVA
ncbi:flagellar hook-length control protein FliK [Stieleria sp. ICT_E10.1]|uniref:flagellar hook-length control protein FliK n=1 Tax=Stieleria sedimenti TaxID=2976331 RepID=UPI00217F2E15|nr:flagellar hook-length control protein FliK [Stieleria sedimenti]MCS7469501.1 flagellar hook-length control protein FliK [Stieleria sedimenti]